MAVIILINDLEITLSFLCYIQKKNTWIISDLLYLFEN